MPEAGSPAGQRATEAAGGAPGSGFRLRRKEGIQAGLITLGAVALFVVVRHLPTGTNLSHMDFRVQGGNSIEFCDPANPQFLPVVTARSPVTLAVTPEVPPVAGSDVDASLVLTTFSGKPIGPADLIVVQTKPIHLMIVDPSLVDYQHVHPVPGRQPGEWRFHFHPRFGGVYRIFADFTPVATARGLYSATDLTVAGPENGLASEGLPGAEPGAKAKAADAKGASADGSGAPWTAGTANGIGPGVTWSFGRDGYLFTLTAVAPIRARKQADLTLLVTKAGGGRVPLQLIMAAYAHLVAFDTARSGFAHIHPNPIDATQAPDAERPTLPFKVMIPAAGDYVLWAEVNLAGRETYAPFWIRVGA